MKSKNYFYSLLSKLCNEFYLNNEFIKEDSKSTILNWDKLYHDYYLKLYSIISFILIFNKSIDINELAKTVE